MITFEQTVPVVTAGKSDYSPRLFAYIPQNMLDIPVNSRRPAVIIFPGGGYSFTFDGEAEPVALNFTAAGICAFVLRYSCAPACFPQQLCEGLWCVKYVRDHAAEYGIDPENISVLGFSAGGHLCASVGTLWQKQEIWQDVLPGTPREYRPDKMILCYPVISSDESCIHKGSFRNLTNQQLEDRALLTLNSLEKQVTVQTPPAFLWQTFEDPSVPVMNSILFAEAEIRCGNYVEMHIYPHGMHGLCTGDHTSIGEFEFGNPHTVNDWLHHAIRFAFDKQLNPVRQ